MIATKTLLLLLHIAAPLGLFIRNLDFGNAYLDSDIDVDLYLKLTKTEWVNGKQPNAHKYIYTHFRKS